MTPAEIQNKKFDKGMGGYKTEDVNLFLSQVADQVRALEDERTELLDKMDILAEKLEQYREDEESLRAALVGAQKLGNSVVRESQRKAEAIIAQAVRQAEQMVTDARMNMDKEAIAFTRMQRDVAGFREKLIRLYSDHLEMIKRFPTEDDFTDTISKYVPVPPKPQQIQEPAPAPAPAPVERATEDTIQFAVIGGDDTEPAPGEDSPLKRVKTKKAYEQINQFFGEDKPIERE